MPSAFISYSHADRDFVQALIEPLEAQGLAIRYDQVVLHVGDSLIRKLSQAIVEDDFLIAVVSPDSVESEWCQTEVALAKNQGIGERRVKVLPVRYHGAAMPPMLLDTVWVEANDDDVETPARRLAAAMLAHLEGRDADAARDAAQVEPAGDGPSRDATGREAIVPLLDRVTDIVWELFEAWAAVWDGPPANLSDLRSPQRRLRSTLDNLPDDVRDGLPLVRHLASAGDDYFASQPDWTDAEADLRAELRSVRTQLAGGLPVTSRWTIDDYLGTMATRRDAVLHLWQIRRGDETARVEVYITRSAIDSTQGLPAEVEDAKRTSGRSVIATLLALDEPPPSVMVSTVDIRSPVED